MIILIDEEIAFDKILTLIYENKNSWQTRIRVGTFLV